MFQGGRRGGYDPEKFYEHQQGVEARAVNQTPEQLEDDLRVAGALGIARKIASGEIKIDPSRKTDVEKLKLAVDFVSKQLGEERLKNPQVRSDSMIRDLSNVLEGLKEIQNSLPEPKKTIIGKLSGLFNK